MRKSGFTLVELIVVVGIVALIATVALANFPAFRGRLALDREAGQLSLALRTAQQFSVSVRRFEENFNDTNLPAACDEVFDAQFPAYAATFDLSENTEYRIVADPDCDRKSDTYPSIATPNDTVESFFLENKVSIQDICINIDSGSPQCGIGKLDVWYIRPSPTVLFTVDDIPDATLDSAKIVLGLEDGSQKAVVMRTTGQVSIQNE